MFLRAGRLHLLLFLSFRLPMRLRGEEGKAGQMKQTAGETRFFVFEIIFR